MNSDISRQVETWWALDGAVHREVARRAADGRRHPDPEVAALADAWATTVDTQPRSAVRRIARNTWDFIRLAGDVVLTAVSDYGSFGICDVTTERGRRRLARQLKQAK